MRPKNLVKVVKLGEIMSKRTPPILTLSRMTYLACIPLRTGVFLSFLGFIIGNQFVKKRTKIHRDNFCSSKEKGCTLLYMNIFTLSLSVVQNPFGSESIVLDRKRSKFLIIK